MRKFPSGLLIPDWAVRSRPLTTTRRDSPSASCRRETRTPETGLPFASITSPKHNHSKSYLIDLHSPITDKQVRILTEGVQLKGEPKRCLPAKIETISEMKIRMIISEGKYHQVKRMMAAVGNHVVKLHREQIGNIKLDENLKENEWRELTAEEIELV